MTTALQKAVNAARALRIMPEQRRYMQRMADLAEEQERLKVEVEKLRREHEHWRWQLIQQVRELTGTGAVGIIQKIVCEELNVSLTDLLSQRRNQGIVRPRMIAQWLSRQCTTRSMPNIGRMFGGRDHTTIMHAVHKIERMRTEDPDLASLLARLKNRVEDKIAAERERILAQAPQTTDGASHPCQPVEYYNGATKEY